MLMRNVLIDAGLVLAAAVTVAQCRKPKWGVGRLYAWLMNRSHVGLTAWGLEHVSIEKDDTILDIGCGGGRTVRSLAAIATDGKVCGIDHSADSVAVARKVNSDLIAAGRVDIQQSSVSRLPFPDSTFDLVTAVETHYYWPDPVNDLREILRVLKPGGSLAIIAEMYKRSERDALYPLIMKLLGGRCPSVREQRDLFAAGGYAAVETFEEPRKGWFCGVGEKRSAGAAD